MIGIYPGSFDPITFGHLDIIERASKITDKLIVAVLNNKNKNHLFSASERADLVAKSITHLNNVSVEIFDGLLVDFAKQKEVSVIIRGIRAVMDFEYELAFSQTNKELNKNIDTLFLMTNIKYSYLSSSVVKEVASYGGDISKFVPSHIINALDKKLNG